MSETTRRDLPNGVVEGFGSLDAATDTPDVMRDCIRERAWEKPVRGEYFTAALYLADDLKRRGYSFDRAWPIILRLPLITREEVRGAEKAVRWVYEKQDHPLGCAETGALVRGGWCHRHSRGCIFYERDEARKTAARARLPSHSPLPSHWQSHFDQLPSTVAEPAKWTYVALFQIETHRHLAAGDERSPIFVGYRALADLVRAERNARGFEKDRALTSIRLLEELGLIRTVVRGKSGTRRRQANGYVHVLPVPLPRPNSPIPPKYDP